MWKRLLIYALVFITTLYLFFLYKDKIVGGLLVFELLYPLAAFAEIFYLSHKLDAHFEKALPLAEKMQEVPLCIHVTNFSSFLNARFCILLTIGNSLSGKGTKNKLNQTVQPRKALSLLSSFQSAYCGNIMCKLERLTVFDSLGFFSHQIKLHQTITIGVLPSYQLLPMEITRHTRDFIADADEYSTQKRGDDPMEIYQIRPYRKKDSLHDIHWKLTAKTGSLMVKEHSLPLGCVVLIKLDIFGPTCTPKETDHILEQVASLSITLMANACIHMVSWFEEKNTCIIKRRIRNEEDVYACIHEILLIEPYQDKQLAEIYFEEAFKGDNFSSTIVVDKKGDLTVNGMKQEFLTI